MKPKPAIYTLIVCVLVVTWAILLIIFTSYKEVTRPKPLEDTVIESVIDNLVLFNYSEDQEYRLGNIESYMTADSRMSLLEYAANHVGYKDYENKKFNTKISSTNIVTDGKGEYLIAVDYMETNIFDDKMTTVIFIKEKNGIIEEITVRDLFDNASNNLSGV